MSKTHLTPYLMFNGQAQEAMAFYHNIFGGKLQQQSYAEGPGKVAPEHKDHIMHAQLTADGVTFMASDSMDGEIAVGANIHLTISSTTEQADELGKWFESLSDGGQVVSPLHQEFWGDTFGVVRDKFGIHWMFVISPTEPSQA